LRRRLVTEGLNDLKANSKVFYAKYRERALKWHRYGALFSRALDLLLTLPPLRARGPKRR
jgi:hypothetical protein